MKKEEIEQLRIGDFHYDLPDGRIAKYPVEPRDASKLLVYSDRTITTAVFRDLPAFLPPESLLVFNNTRVIHARLLFRKPTGAVVEVFCLSPLVPEEYNVNFQQRERCAWSCMIGNAKRWKDESLQMEVASPAGSLTLVARRKGTCPSGVAVEFSWNDPSFTFSEVLEFAGKLPIPPYLNRASEEKDDETYQTVYSYVEGSVAAPTAGLHFTAGVMEKLRQKGLSTVEVTLHVGAGTFKPVKSPTIGGHGMHTECLSVSRDAIASLLAHNGKTIVVGTTSLRTVESLYYIGAKLYRRPDALPHELSVSQWEPYEQDEEIPPKAALQSILDYLDRHGEEQLISATQILIAPGYRFRYADALVTNFHQPESTLLLLISAFVGDDWRQIYRYALDNGFRFLSYGDSSLLWRE